MSTSVANWNNYIKIDPSVGDSQRIEINNFLNRVAASDIGKIFLAQVRDRGNLEISLSRIRSTYTRKGIGTPTAKIRLYTGLFSDGNNTDIIGTFFHELTHHVYPEHYHMAVSPLLKGIDETLRSRANELGISEAKWDRIVAPIREITEFRGHNTK